MYDKLPNDRQAVEVCVDNHDEWQAATFQNGEFVDAYGMPLDRRHISNWRPSDNSASRPH
jgi:hypothetical protein